MRTDVKVGVAGGALILIVAVAYYGAKRNEVTLADGSTGAGVSSPLDELLGHAQTEAAPGKKSASTRDTAAKSKPAAKSTPPKKSSKPAPARRTTAKKPQGVNAHPQKARQQPRRQSQTASRGKNPRGQAGRSDGQRNTPVASTQATAPDKGATKPQRSQRVPQGFKPAQPERGSNNVASENIRQRPRAGGRKSPSQQAVAGNTRKTTADAALERLKALEKTTVPTPRESGRRSGRQPNADRQSASRPTTQLASTRTHTVESGDTFAGIAIHYYGSEKHTAKLIAANPGVDPRRLQLGDQLRVPHISQTTAAPTPQKPRRETARRKTSGAAGIYVVQEGDTFYGIASKVLGAGHRWREIYELNRDIIGSDPNQLSVGQELKVPKS